MNRFADLRNTDLNSEIFMKKVHRAQEALSQSDGSGTNSIKTLSASFGTKWPYKRTMSAPASMIPRQDTKQGTRISRFINDISWLTSNWLLSSMNHERVGLEDIGVRVRECPSDLDLQSWESRQIADLSYSFRIPLKSNESLKRAEDSDISRIIVLTQSMIHVIDLYFRDILYIPKFYYQRRIPNSRRTLRSTIRDLYRLSCWLHSFRVTES